MDLLARVTIYISLGMGICIFTMFTLFAIPNLIDKYQDIWEDYQRSLEPVVIPPDDIEWDGGAPEIIIQPDTDLEDKSLQAIFQNCACQEAGGPCIQPLFSWKNDTHYSDNNFCRFVEQPDVCTDSMMGFINHWSNMFEGEEPLTWTFRGSDSIVDSQEFDDCRDELIKINKKSN